MMSMRAVVAASMVFVSAAGFSPSVVHAQNESDSDELPLFEEFPKPTATELLKARAFDWIVLKNGRVIVIEPMTPRPYPLAWVNAVIFDHLRKKPNEIRDGEAALAEWREQRLKMDYLNIIIRDEASKEEETDFRIHIKYVEKFVHFEDHIVAEISRLVEQGDLRTAYELLVLLTRRDALRIREFRKFQQDMKVGKAVPKLQVAENTSLDKAFKYDPEKEVPWDKPWPGLAKAHHRLIFADAQQLQKADRLHDAMARVEELHSRNKLHPGLRKIAGEIADTLIEESSSAKDYRKARYHISRLTELYRSHVIAEKWKTEIEGIARREMIAGRNAFNKGKQSEGVRTIRDALYIWPDSSEIKREYRQAASRYQILRVGIVEEKSPKGYPFQSTTSWRRRKLVERPLMHVDYYRDGTPHYASKYFEDWIPADLGRKLRFKLRKSRAPWESHAVVETTDVVAALNRHLTPGTPQFDERLSVFVEGVAPITPNEFVVNLRSIPTRPEALIDILLGSTEPKPAIGTSPGGEQNTEFASYIQVRQSPQEVAYVRRYAEPSDLLDFRVAEVHEREFPSFKEVSRAFARQKIDYIPQVRPKDVIPFLNDERVFVQPYSVPETHFLQFHPESPFFRLQNIRRAMQYILDKPTLLTTHILQKTDLTDEKTLSRMQKRVRVVTAPFATSLFGYNKLVEPSRYEPSTATALVFVDRTKLSAIGRPLKFLCPENELEKNAAQRILESWKRIGIDAEMVTFDAADSRAPEWDIAYRKVRMQDPVYDLSKLLAMKQHVTTDDLKYLPAWIVRELHQLDLVSDVRAALSKLRQIHAALAREVILIPLWEIDEAAIFRRNVRGFPQELVHPYHGIDKWVIQPSTNVE